MDWYGIAQMTSEQPPRDALRPLPSIDIPLLREERSAVRSRRVVGVAVAAALGAVAAGLGWVLSMRGDPDTHRVLREPESRGGSATPHLEGTLPGAVEGSQHGARGVRPGSKGPASGPSPAEAGAKEAATTAKGPFQRSEYPFGRAVSFRHALQNAAGLSVDEANGLIEALTGVLDFRRSQPSDTLAVERDPRGKLTRFEYKSGLTLHYEAVRRDAGGFFARQVPVPIRLVRVSKGGVVQGSLGDTLEGLSLGRSLAGIFSEVFEGKINFFTDTRSGDTFRIVLEQAYVGETLLRYGPVRALEYKGAKSGTLQAFWHGPSGGEGDYYDAHGRALHGGWLRTPLRYDHISSGFGMRFHPVLKRKQLHNGVDYAAGSGTQVRAAAHGTVTFAGAKGANGNLLAIAHASGFETFYAHLLRFAPGIKKGAKVTQRQVVAYVGSTGRSTGPHLHFSLKRHGRFVDPMSQLNGPGLPMPATELPEFRRNVRELAGNLSRIPLQTPAAVASPSQAASAVSELGEEDL